ncbi:PREDICTED: transmembrane protein 106B-like [Priapulus caudatus]|uniref:Transmembrane protein 106B-like n=1 Tax=Priapulus caudatus TaxID=37621 RepID=A0ABM1ER48_PRICU|nr:PREDICTED: transmembrane protein 106B-like [Priapulus caudatus]
MSKICPVYVVFFSALQNTYNLSNQNYVKVRGSNATMVAMYDTKIVGEVKDLQVFHVPLRSTVVIAIPMNITFGDDEGYLAKFCTGSSSWLHNIALSFTVTIETTYLNHVEQIARTSFQYVNCAPTATTTTTTTTTVAPATTQPTTDAGAT